MKHILYMHNSHHQSSSVGQIISFLETLKETTVSIRNCFPQSDRVSHIQKYFDLFIIIFRSGMDQIRIVDDPDAWQLLFFFHFFQYYSKNWYVFQTIPTISKYKTTLSNYLASLEPLQEVFDFQNIKKFPPLIPNSQFKDFKRSTKQKMAKHLGSLLSADPDIFPLTQPTTMQATRTTLILQFKLQIPSVLI